MYKYHIHTNKYSANQSMFPNQIESIQCTSWWMFNGYVEKSYLFASACLLLPIFLLSSSFYQFFSFEGSRKFIPSYFEFPKRLFNSFFFKPVSWKTKNIKWKPFVWLFPWKIWKDSTVTDLFLWIFIYFVTFTDVFLRLIICKIQTYKIKV